MIPYHLRAFVKLHPEVEGIIQHVGLRTWDLLLLDVQGDWDRDEFPSEEAAREACRLLGVRAHDGFDEPRIVRRMASRDPWGGPGGQRRAL